MKVLIITRYFWPEDGVAEEPLMLKEYVKWHLNKGHLVEIVTGARPNHLEKWKLEFSDSLVINHFFATLDRESSFISRVINSAILLFLSVKAILCNRKFDLIYVFSGPPLIALFINLFNLVSFKKSLILFSIQDNVIYRIKNRLLRFIFKIQLKLTVFLSDIVLVLSEPMKEEIISYFRQNSSKDFFKKIYVLVNFCSDLDKKALQRIHKNKTIDILYAGNHGPSQGLKDFIGVLSRIDLNKRPKVSFFGEGTDKENIIKYAKLNAVKVDFNDPISRREIKKIMSQSKFGLVSMTTSLSRYAFPSKLAAYLSVGTQVIISTNGADHLTDYIKKYNFGYTIDNSVHKHASNNLVEMLATKNSISSEYFYKNVIDEFDKEQYFEKLENILDSYLDHFANDKL